LNVKKLEFDTVWLEYHEIEPMISKLGGKPTNTKPDGYVLCTRLAGNSPLTRVSLRRSPWYTLPVIYDPATKKIISNSRDIAEYLDQQYPTTQTLVLDPAFETEWEGVILTNVIKTFPMSAFMVLHNRVSLPAARHIRRIREAQFGKTLEEGSAEEAVSQQWKGFESGFINLSEVYKKGGTAFLNKGDAPAWADLVVGSWLISQKFIYGEDSKQWKNILEWDGGLWKKLNEALKVYEGEGLE
jgi:glutathione S-transferase